MNPSVTVRQAGTEPCYVVIAKKMLNRGAGRTSQTIKFKALLTVLAGSVNTRT